MKKRMLNILLVMIMVTGLSLGMMITANAESSVDYIECSWDGSKVVKTPKIIEEYTIVDETTTSMGTNSWYVVQGNVTIEGRVIVDGVANLILADGCKLTVNGGINVNGEDTLNIYAQSQGTGVLKAFASGDFPAGIGGGPSYGKTAGSLIIHGGEITAKGASRGAGIGGSGASFGTVAAGQGGKVTIYDGTVNATGGYYKSTVGPVAGAGIGGGGGGEHVNSNSGGKGGTVAIYGGTVTAQGGHTYAAGIGGGYAYGPGGTLNVFGGIVTADIIGKAYMSSSYDGTKSYENCIVNRTVYGSVVLPDDFIVPDGKKFTVSSGATLVIPEGVALTVDSEGKLYNHGEIQNRGTLILQQAEQFSGRGTVSGTGSFLIANITEDQIQVSEDLVYNGEDQTDVVEEQISLSGKSVVLGGATFRYDTNGWERTISPATVKDAGTYTVTYRKANYSVEKTFVVAPMDITGAVVVPFAPMTYNGAAQTPEAEVSIGNLAVTGTWSEVIQVADETMFTADGNFTGDLGPMETTMSPKSVAAEVIVQNKYWDNSTNADITVSVDTGVAGDEITVTGVMAAFADKEIGTSKTVLLDKSNMTVTGNRVENYTVSVPDEASGDICIIPLTISGVNMSAESFVYGDEPAGYDSAALTISQPGGISATADDLVYRYTGTANDGSEWNSALTPIMAGDYVLTVSHADTVHYSGAQEIPFSIAKAEVAEPTQAAAVTYNGKEQTYALTSTDYYSVETVKQVNSNEIGYPVVISLKDKYNYQWETAGNSDDLEHLLVINKASVTVTARDQNHHVGTKLPETVEEDQHYTITGLVEGDSLGIISLEYRNNGAVVTPDIHQTGTYDIVMVVSDANSNYEISCVNGTLSYYYSEPTFRPSIVVIGGGEVSVNRKNPEQGEKVTIATDSDKGYKVDKVIVTDRNGNIVEVTNNGDGTYTFKQPYGSVSINVVYVPVETAFSDISKDSYYYDAVNWALAEGITSGVAKTTFAPDMVCTRAQAVTFLWRAAGSPEPKSAEMPFDDVSANAYYHDAVLWAVENGITIGTSSTTFAPNMECTRAQIVTFLWRSQKSPAVSAENPFVDVAADSYYNDAVLWAAKEEITSGTSATTFSPNAYCTRAQIVTFLFHCLLE